MAELRDEVYRSIENALLVEREYDPDLNVVGFGVGKKIRNGSITDEGALCIYVHRKIPINSFPRATRARPFNKVISVDKPVRADDLFDVGMVKQADRRPGSSQLRIDVIEVENEILLQVAAPRGQMPRVMGGVSIGLDKETNGTAGCIVRNDPHNRNNHGGNRDFYLLTAGHVLNKYGQATTKNVCHPGPNDITARSLNPANCIFATTLDTTPPLSYSQPPFPVFHVDAGIASFNGTMIIDQFEERVLYCGGIREAGMAQEGAIVKKVGRTTGMTFGQITHERGSFTIHKAGSSDAAILSDQIITTSMSQTGDSGALLLDQDNRVLGLLCASSDDVSVFTPISVVLHELGLELF